MGENTGETVVAQRNYGGPLWYCKEVEFRYVRDLDLYEVGCSGCGYKNTTSDRRFPKETYVSYLIKRGCTCE